MMIVMMRMMMMMMMVLVAALGTLYAYENAVKKAESLLGFDLHGKLIRKEISAALYHTAGKGTR
jgi:hypothetical protein